MEAEANSVRLRGQRVGGDVPSRAPSPSGRDSRRGLARRLAHSRQTLSLYGLSGRSPKPQREVRLLGPRSARRWVGALSYRMVGDCLHQGLVARIGWPGDTSHAANNSARGDAQVGCHPLAENTSSGERRGKSTPPDTGKAGAARYKASPPAFVAKTGRWTSARACRGAPFPNQGRGGFGEYGAPVRSRQLH